MLIRRFKITSYHAFINAYPQSTELLQEIYIADGGFEEVGSADINGQGSFPSPLLSPHYLRGYQTDITSSEIHPPPAYPSVQEHLASRLHQRLPTKHRIASPKSTLVLQCKKPLQMKVGRRNNVHEGETTHIRESDVPNNSTPDHSQK
jgi:hypothetical protein